MTLKRTVFYTSLGYGAYSACNFLMGIIIGRFGHNFLGLYGTAANLCNPFLVLGSLNLRNLYVMQVFTKFNVEDYLGTRITNFVIMLAAVFFWATYKLNGDLSMTLLTIVFMLGNGCDQAADIYFGIYQIRDRVDLLALSQTLRGILSILLFYVFFILCHHSLVWGVAGSSLASLIMLVGFDLPIGSWVETSVWGKFIFPRLIRKDYWTIVKEAFPLSLSVFMDTFALAYPIVVVAQFFGAGDNTSITGYGYLVNLGQIFVAGITIAIAPRLGQTFNGNLRKDFFKVVRWGTWGITAIAVGILAITYLFGPEIIRLVFHNKFPVDQLLFMLIVIGGAIRFGTSLLGIVITSAKWVKGQVFWSLPRLLLALAITGPLVHRYGLYGAAWAILIPTFLKLILGFGILGWISNAWKQEKLHLITPSKTA